MLQYLICNSVAGCLKPGKDQTLEGGGCGTKNILCLKIQAQKHLDSRDYPCGREAWTFFLQPETCPETPIHCLNFRTFRKDKNAIMTFNYSLICLQNLA